MGISKLSRVEWTMNWNCLDGDCRCWLEVLCQRLLQRTKENHEKFQPDEPVAGRITTEHHLKAEVLPREAVCSPCKSKHTLLQSLRRLAPVVHMQHETRSLLQKSPCVLTALIKVSVKSFCIFQVVLPLSFRKSCMLASSGVSKSPSPPANQVSTVGGPRI